MDVQKKEFNNGKQKIENAEKKSIKEIKYLVDPIAKGSESLNCA